LREVVLDASVVLKWFHSEGEARAEAARKLRQEFEAGELKIAAPPLLWLEILNVAARRWGWSSAHLEALATSLSELGFELVEPEPEAIARWAGRGLTAYDAAYVAVAEEIGVPVITDDAQICQVAADLTEPLRR
jgi:predicted nucleic acid-binding protein